MGALLRVLPRVQRASLLAVFTLSPLLAALLLLLRLRLSQVPDLSAVWWPLVISPLRVRWTLDGWNWLMMFMLLLVGVNAVLLIWREPGVRASAFHGLSFLLMGTASLVVVSGNLLTLSGAWVASDVLLIARSRASRMPQGAVAGGLVAGGSLLMLLAIGITSLSAATAPLTATVLPGETLALLMLAAALRMGIYPLHLWLTPGQAGRSAGTQLLLGSVALVTGGWLLGRLYPLGIDQWLSNPVWQPLLAALVLAAGVMAWAAQRADRQAGLSASRASWLWFSLALAAPALGQDALGWGIVTVVLGMALFVVGDTIRSLWGWRVPLVLSLGVLAGGPFLVGLAVRALAPPSNPLLWLLAVVGEGLALACVMAALLRPAALVPTVGSPGMLSLTRRGLAAASESSGWLPVSWPVIRMFSAFLSLAVPALIWGVRPELLAQLAGFSISPTLGDLLGVMSFGQWASLLLSLALAGGLAWVLGQPQSSLARSRGQLTAVMSLRWALDAILWLAAWASEAASALLRVLEGEGYLGWVALAALLLWLVVRS
jgi:hypothetical protein